MVRNKLNFLALSKDADVIFSYGLSKYADTSNLKLLYLGQAGQTPKISSSTFRIVSSPNFASEYMADYVVASVFAYERRLLQNFRNGKI